MFYVYKFKFIKPPDELNYDYERFSDIDKQKLANINMNSFIDYEEDNQYAFFIIAEPIEIDKYIQLLNNNLIKFEYKDISNDILKGEIDIECELEYNEEFDYCFFIKCLNEWIYQNLDIDIVLDKISSVGMKYLTKIEKKFLKNYKI